jgi:hypothetical protein
LKGVSINLVSLRELKVINLNFNESSVEFFEKKKKHYWKREYTNPVKVHIGEEQTMYQARETLVGVKSVEWFPYGSVHFLMGQN